MRQSKFLIGILAFLMVVGLAVAGTARAEYIEFANPNLLGTDPVVSLTGESTGHSLSYLGGDIATYTMDFNAYQWYGTAAPWTPGTNPGASTAAPLYMSTYRGEYGLAVGLISQDIPGITLPVTGVNELDQWESLKITFSSAVILNSITLGNIYLDEVGAPPESGWLVFDGNYAIPWGFSAPLAQVWTSANNDPGTYVITLPAGFKATTIEFFASAIVGDDASSGSDYLVRGVSVTPTPEPGTMALLGSGVLAVWARRRFGRKK